MKSSGLTVNKTYSHILEVEQEGNQWEEKKKRKYSINNNSLI
jgi:hypothetical protein